MTRSPQSIFIQAALLFLLTGCASNPRTAIDHPPVPPSLKLLKTDTLDGIGAGQALALYQGKLLALGDSQTGIIREYSLQPQGLTITPTGRSIRLTRGETDLLPHPTGLAHRQHFPTFLGDTVRRIGTIWHLDLDLALSSGNLDSAALASIQDSAATNGTRPEYVKHYEKWLIATADYGNEGNTLRLMDPKRLAAARTTSDPGVIVATFPAPPFVQSMHYVDSSDTLILVQNITPGLGYRLTFIPRFSTRPPGTNFADTIAYPPSDLPELTDELEGFVMLSPSLGLMLCASSKNNLHWVKVITHQSHH